MCVDKITVFSLAIFFSLIITNYFSKIYISRDILKEQKFHKTYNEFKVYEKYFNASYVRFIELTKADIQRHPAVAEVLGIYGD